MAVAGSWAGYGTGRRRSGGRRQADRWSRSWLSSPPEEGPEGGTVGIDGAARRAGSIDEAHRGQERAVSIRRGEEVLVVTGGRPGHWRPGFDSRRRRGPHPVRAAAAMPSSRTSQSNDSSARATAQHVDDGRTTVTRSALVGRWPTSTASAPATGSPRPRDRVAGVALRWPPAGCRRAARLRGRGRRGGAPANGWSTCSSPRRPSVTSLTLVADGADRAARSATRQTRIGGPKRSPRRSRDRPGRVTASRTGRNAPSQVALERHRGFPGAARTSDRPTGRRHGGTIIDGSR